MAARAKTIELPILIAKEMQHQVVGKLKGFELVLNAKGCATIAKLDCADKPPYAL